MMDADRPHSIGPTGRRAPVGVVQTFRVQAGVFDVRDNMCPKAHIGIGHPAPNANQATNENGPETADFRPVL
jgi:hypothetical protein